MRRRINSYAGGRGRGAPPAPQEPPTSVCSWLRARAGPTRGGRAWGPRVGLSADRTRSRVDFARRWRWFTFAMVTAVLGLAGRTLAHSAPFSYLDLKIGVNAIEGALVVHDFDAAHDLGI